MQSVAKRPIDEFLELALSGQCCSEEYCITSPDGDKKWLKVEYVPVYTSGTNPSGVSIKEKDVTAKKEMLSELNKLKVNNVNRI